MITNYITSFIRLDKENKIIEYRTFSSLDKLFKWLKPSYSDAEIIKKTLSNNKRTGLCKIVYYGKDFQVRKTKLER